MIIKKTKTSDDDTTEVLILIPTPAGGDGIGTRCFINLTDLKQSVDGC